MPELDLSELSNGHPYAPFPHMDPILDMARLSTSSSTFPYVCITYRTLYIMNSTHHATLGCHLRSEESLKQFGTNQSLRLSPNGKFIAIKTNSNHLLVYHIEPMGTDKEVLLVYSKSGDLVQNGYPCTSYHTIEGSSFGTNHVDNKGLFDGLIQTFVGTGDNEKPNKDINLRLKVIFNCSVNVNDFTFVDNTTILIIQEHDGNNSAMLVDFKADKKVTEEEVAGIKQSETFVDFKKLDWFRNENISDNNQIVKLEYNYSLDISIMFNSCGDAMLVKRDPDNKLLSFFAKIIYKSKNELKAIDGQINYMKSLIYILLENGDTLIYKLRYDTEIKLLKVIKKPINSKNVQALVMDPNGISFVVHFDNGWNIYSFLGNLNFSSFDYDNLKLIKFNKIVFNGKDQMVVTNGHELFDIMLNNLNFGNQSNSNCLKRPVLFNEDKITIFKFFEKKLFDHHHFKYNSNEMLEKDTNIWLTETLPLEFRIKNSAIRSISVSDDGCHVCIIGDYDILYFNVDEGTWKTLNSVLNEDVNFQKVETPVKACMWWNDYLLLAVHNEKEKKSQIYILSNKFTKGKKVSFDLEEIIWSFDFNNGEEAFVGFNIDSYSNELLILTDDMNVYSWKLELNGKKLKVIKYIVYRLKDSFPEQSLMSIITNFNSIMKINESELLILANTDLYYIQRSGNGKKSISYLIKDSVEYMMKLNSTTFALFNGGEIVRYNLSKEKNILKCRPITLSIGNEVVYDAKGVQILKSSGTTAYPISLIWNKNIIIGLEIEVLGSHNQMVLETVKINYLHDLVHHYINMNIGVFQDEDDMNVLSIIGVYNEFHKAKNFKFVLERLTVDYIQKCNEDKGYDEQGEYFEKLMDLINMTSSPYEIILNCLKKSEIQYWSIFFTRAKTTPREIVNKLFDVDGDYHWAAHYLVIMMNYEQNVTNTTLSNRDIKLMSKILLMLIVNEDFETSFAIMRFIKLIDEKTCAKVYEKLKYKIEATK